MVFNFLFYIYAISNINLSIGLYIIVPINNAQSEPVKINCSSITRTDERIVKKPLNGESTNVTSQIHYINSSKDVGLYNCVDPEINKTFVAINLTTPVIPHTGQSIIALSDDVNHTFECISYSFPSPTFTWSVQKDNGRIENITAGSNLSFYIENRVHFSYLKVPTVTASYRGTYKCTVTNFGLNATTEVKFRVHERLAPLWPFFGILAEVTIIAFFIYLIRKKAVKEERRFGVPFQDSNSSDDYFDNSHSDLRHRNTVHT